MAKFRAIVNAVRQAITGNATTADVLSGKTFMSSSSPNEQTGAMTNNGAVTESLTTRGQVYTIPAGYHNGAGTVTANVPSEEPALLWINQIPTQEFAGQTITLDLSEYDGVIVRFNLSNTTTTPVLNAYGAVGASAWAEINNPRGFTVSTTGITFDNATGGNTGMIPAYIWGIKGALPTT